jgi:hypothetical protein
MTTPAQVRAFRKAMTQKIIYTPAPIRKIRKALAQGRPNTGKIS